MPDFVPSTIVGVERVVEGGKRMETSSEAGPVDLVMVVVVVVVVAGTRWKSVATPSYCEVQLELVR